ncbi:MAG TPA: helix-turn-helix transcriptional regulator [Candidatus Obscuribacterales bacterium]
MATRQPSASPAIIQRCSFDVLVRALAEVVQEQRELLGLTQDELANKVGLHRTYISQLECCKRNPSIVTLTHLSHCFEVPLSRFLTWVEEKIEQLEASAGHGYPVSTAEVDGHLR